MKTIDALRPGEMGRRYVVATFPGERPGQFRAYSRIYNPAWAGCVEYEVIAASGAEAKRAAIKARREEIV
jgi:hypothetical protein